MNFKQKIRSKISKIIRNLPLIKQVLRRYNYLKNIIYENNHILKNIQQSLNQNIQNNNNIITIEQHQNPPQNSETENSNELVENEWDPGILEDFSVEQVQWSEKQLSKSVYLQAEVRL